MAVWYVTLACGLAEAEEAMPLCPVPAPVREVDLPGSLRNDRTFERKKLRSRPPGWLAWGADFPGLARACRLVDLSVFISIH